MLLYNNAIKILLEKFPKLKVIYNEDQDFYVNLPYVFYETVFTKYVIQIIDSDNKPELNKAFNFVEKALKEGDEDFKNLIEVAVLEALFFKRIFDDNDLVWGSLGELSKESVKKCTPLNN